MLKKLLFAALIVGALLVAHRALFAWQFSVLSAQCTTQSTLDARLAAAKTIEEKNSVSREFWSCVRSKQNAFDRLLVRVPEAWQSSR